MITRSDNSKEYASFSKFYKEYIFHEFSAPNNLEQNGVVERKSRYLQEMVKVMENSKKLYVKLWAEAVNTICYILNRVSLKISNSQTPYKIWKGRKPNLKYFHTSESKCYVLSPVWFLLFAINSHYFSF